MTDLRKTISSRWPSRPARRDPRRGRGGFTLVELMVVIVIIGILVSFVLVASYQGLERANERATQALIVKLDQGLTERLDALLTQPISPNGAHQFLAAILPPSLPSVDTTLPLNNPRNVVQNWGLPSDNRAQVIATLDYLKREMPDVFFVQTVPTASSPDPTYPLNFASVPYPGGGAGAVSHLLPLGHMSRAYRYAELDSAGLPLAGPGDNDPAAPNTTGSSAGVFGASWTALGAFNKLLGCAPSGYDTVDNDGDGWIDEWDECIVGLTPAQVAELSGKYARHQHKTARSEALYALLVSGVGPLGSAFSPEDFRPGDIKDTDNDGLPEFVDAWGEPLQFYRWPVHYRSGIQRGAVNPLRYETGAWQDGYTNFGSTDTRQQNPVDPNQQLMAPAWWFASFNANTGAGFTATPMSNAAYSVMNYFTPLVDYNAAGATGPKAPTATRQLWDRTGGPRGAYYSKFLIVSSGQDQLLGVAQLPASAVSAASLNLVENTASSLNPSRVSGTAPFFADASAPGGPDPVTYQLTTVDSQDDISNQNLQSANGGIR